MQQHPKDKKEAGAALFEAVLTIPILLVFALAVIDLGNWFFQHYNLSRVVYEGARAAAGLGDIEEADPAQINASNYEEIDTIPCLKELLNSSMSESQSFNEQGHFIVQSRMNILAQRHFGAASFVMLDAANSWSCYDETGRVVLTQASIPFQSILLNTFNFRGWIHDANMWPTVTARARAPYLFSN